TEAADRISGKVHFDQTLGRFAAQVFIHPALHDAEEIRRLTGELLSPWTLMLMRIKMPLAALGPAQREVERLPCSFILRRILRAFIEGHGDIGPERDLHIHRM